MTVLLGKAVVVGSWRCISLVLSLQFSVGIDFLRVEWTSLVVFKTANCSEWKGESLRRGYNIGF